MNPQAQELNDILKDHNPVVLDLLSRQGKEIFFPKSGILAQAAAAKGKKINATIGIAIEDDGAPMCLPSLADKLNMEPSKIFPYAPSYGRPDLRKVWQEMLFKKNPGLKGKSISLPVATCGITHALNIAAYLFLGAGSEIYIPDLYWGNYNLIFKAWHDVEIKNYHLFKEGKMDLEALAGVLQGSGRTIRLLMNFPNNPSGYTPTKDEAKEITRLIKASAESGNKILVMLDDAYFGLVYEKDIITESLFTQLSDVHENVLALKLDGATKEDYVWGFRVAFITFGIKGGSDALYNALASKAGGAIRGNISNIANISQSLLLEAFTSPTYDQEKTEKFTTLKKRYNEVKDILEKKTEYKEYFEAVPFNSGYFMCIRLREDLDTQKIWQNLLDNYDTGVIRLQNIFRIAFSAIPKSLIEEMFANIYQAIQDSLK